VKGEVDEMTATAKRGRTLINAQALIGTTPGTCTLQKIIGQGAMGAVFLGQQSRPERQVAVKVVAPLTSQHSDQQTAFLERFHQEMTAVAALKHQNILPIYEYGEHDGLAYLVMPYISSGTLQHVLAQEGPLSLAKVADYLSQLAAALDCAHQQGVVHRNVQPANVLKTPDGRLLLTDFGLLKIVVEQQTSQMYLLQAGKLVGALEYMAPEQVMGDIIDARTDLYALGVIVYQMVTGKTPFQSGTPMELAIQLVQTPPPSPCSLRRDLSLAVEQVILRAIAKHPADRYSSVQDFANEFRLALTTGSSINMPPALSSASPTKERANIANPVTPPVPAPTPTASLRSRDFFALTWQKVEDASNLATDDTLGKSKSNRLLPMTEMANAPQAENLSTLDGQNRPVWLVSTMKKPSFVRVEETAVAEETTTDSSEQSNAQSLRASSSACNTPLPPTRSHRGLRTSLVRSIDDGAATSASVANSEQSTTNRQQLPFTFNFNAPPVPTPAPAVLSAPSSMPTPISTESMLAAPEQLAFSLRTSPTIPQVGQTPQPELSVPIFATANTTRTLAPDSEQDQVGPSSPPKSTVPNPLSPFPASQVTGTLMHPLSEQGNTSTVKLTSSVKVVQVPVAGQPGRYVTGFLPVLPEAQPLQQTSEVGDSIRKKLPKQWQKVAALALVVLLVLSVSGLVAFHGHSNPNGSATSNTNRKIATPNMQATVLVQATETAEANIILSDPLNQNIHNWPVNASGDKIYIFKDGAYHILNNDPQQSLPALLSGVDIKVPMVYTLTMEEIRGNDSSLNNSFGVILRFSSPQIVHAKIHTTFYTFQVVNTAGGEYQFSKYDDINGPAVNPYQTIWHHPFGKEFRQGQGGSHVNTFKIVADGKFFTFFVNGRKVGNVEDSSLSEGEVGMIVNLKGTEVAFTNLLLTYN
jgi:eukaryotic-like serine/threonine-protein kinase